MASTTSLGTSSIAFLPSRYLSSSSSSSNPSIHTLSLTSGQSCSRKLYGGIGINGTKGRSRFPVVNVATEVNSVEQQV
ncbi:magnesium-chelatase subunit ChlI chloroplastic-like, partial [Trifolium pratense]